ncbi:hypothetical protein [Rhodoplanes sp. SY1]|uniref:hypothetical protein n=1 Tax=Rhodoplanes sp. SY1 TaxID=3166646 RepID=UPI0038B5FD2C
MMTIGRYRARVDKLERKLISHDEMLERISAERARCAFECMAAKEELLIALARRHGILDLPTVDMISVLEKVAEIHSGGSIHFGSLDPSGEDPRVDPDGMTYTGDLIKIELEASRNVGRVKRAAIDGARLRWHGKAGLWHGEVDGALLSGLQELFGCKLRIRCGNPRENSGPPEPAAHTGRPTGADPTDGKQGMSTDTAATLGGSEEFGHGSIDHRPGPREDRAQLPPDAIDPAIPMPSTPVLGSSPQASQITETVALYSVAVDRSLLTPEQGANEWKELRLHWSRNRGAWCNLVDADGLALLRRKCSDAVRVLRTVCVSKDRARRLLAGAAPRQTDDGDPPLSPSSMVADEHATARPERRMSGEARVRSRRPKSRGGRRPRMACSATMAARPRTDRPGS